MLDSHYDLSVLEIFDARILMKEHEATSGADTHGEEPRAADDRGGAAPAPRQLAKISRRAFADSVRRCPDLDTNSWKVRVELVSLLTPI